jgi:hypothetical protein
MQVQFVKGKNKFETRISHLIGNHLKPGGFKLMGQTGFKLHRPHLGAEAHDVALQVCI